MDHSYLELPKRAVFEGGCSAHGSIARYAQYASPRLIRGGGIRNRRIWVLRVIPYISSPLGEVPGSRGRAPA